MRTIIKMVHYTRLDAAISSAALMRQALAQALHHAAHRTAFGRRLIDQPLMRNVLADLALEVESASALVMRLARAFDRSAQDRAEHDFARLATAIAKYWVCKRAPGAIAEALECLGGNGYVEESILPRLYREAPVNSIWEGAGNVVCLDVLRALAREPDSLEARARGAAERPRRRPAARRPAGPPEQCARRPEQPRAPGAAAGRAAGARSCRPRSWSGTRRPRSPTRSAPRGCPTIRSASSASCRADSISARSAPAPDRPSNSRRLGVSTFPAGWPRSYPADGSRRVQRPPDRQRRAGGPAGPPQSLASPCHALYREGTVEARPSQPPACACGKRRGSRAE